MAVQTFRRLATVAGKYRLQWVESGRRWRKQYRGKQYYFPLQDGETKASSYRRCLGEWEAAKREADKAVTHSADGPVAGWLLWARGLQDAYRRAGDDVRYTRVTKAIGEAERALLRGIKLEVTDEFILKLPSKFDAPADAPSNVEIANRRIDSVMDQTTENLAPASTIEATERPWDHDTPVPSDRTIGGLLVTFQAAHPKVDKSRLNRYRDWSNLLADVATIDGSHCRAYRNHLEAETTRPENAISRKYAKDCLSTFKQYCKYLVADVAALETLPKNFDDLIIEVPTTTVQTIDVATFHAYLIGGRSDDKPMTEALKRADERMRLYLLLMANCGMTQIDVSEFAPDQVDWDNGRIIRKRSKLEKSDGNVPMSNYRLWPETFALLCKHRSDDAKRVLLNAKGQPLVTRSVGGSSRNDSIRLAFTRFRKRLCMESELPLKHIRKTSASMIAKRFGEETATLFLGDALRTTAGKHYIAVDDDRLDKPLRHLRQAYNIETVLTLSGAARKPEKS